MSIFKRFLGKKEPQRTGPPSIIEEMKSLVPIYVRFATRDPHEIVDVLFAKFLPEIPVLSDDQFKAAYKNLREKWGPLALLEGTEAEVKTVILRNAQSFSQRPDYKYFTIPRFEADKGEEAVEMGVTVGGITWLVVVWKTAGGLHAFGRNEFLNY